MFEALRCVRKGHMFVDSQSQPGTEVCIRCHQRRSHGGPAAPETHRTYDRSAEASGQDASP